MITRNNLTDVINLIDSKDKKRILNTRKDYVVLYLHIFNAGSYVTIRLTDDYWRYRNVAKDGNAILYTEEIQDLLNEIK